MKFSEKEIRIKNQDTDVKVVFPNGQHLTLQYRIENQSVDIIMPEENTPCTVWQGWDMNPAKLTKQGDSKIGQIVVNLAVR